MENIVSYGLEETLSSILVSLANFFGTTTETILENAPEWLAKYGWYVTLSDKILDALFGGFFLSSILSIGVFGVLYELKVSSRKILITVFTFFGVILIGSCLFHILPCLVAPEITGLDALIKALK